MGEILIAAVLTIITAATPLVYAALGEMITEKSGVLNLGVEGMMLVGAVCGFAAVHATDSATVGILVGILAGAGLALIFAILVLGFQATQVATGLALTIFGIGISALIGQNLVGIAYDGLPKLAIPLLSSIPVLGKLLFNHDILVYGSFVSVFVISWFLKKTRGGLILRAVGDSHDAAHAIGYPVIRIRYMAILFGRRDVGVGRGVSVIVLFTIVDREHECRSWLDCACFSGIRNLAALAGFYRGLFIWRHYHFTVAWSGVRSRYSCSGDVHASLCGDDCCSGFNIPGPQ